MIEDEDSEVEAVEASAFSVTPPPEYENERLRQTLAEVNDQLIQARITIQFQNDVIAAMRVAIPLAPGEVASPE